LTTLGDAGATVTDNNTGAVTVNTVVPLRLPHNVATVHDAVIVAFPTVRPLAVPVVAPTVAIDVLDEVQFVFCVTSA
jgi:hypothetical protein